MRKLSSWAKGGLMLSPLFVAMTAAAAGASDDVSPAVRSAMQRDLGLTSAQVSQYLKIERLASLEEKQLAAAQGRNFGGSWIERTPDGNYQLVIATTAIPASNGRGEVEFRSVRHAQVDLETSKASLDDVLARGGNVPKGVYGWYVDLQSNSVVVSIGKGHEQAAINFVAASGADAQTIRVVVEEEQPSLRSTLKGGHGYLRNPGDGYLYACSIGFNVTKGSTPAYVSAGHCGTANEPVYFEGSAGIGPQWSIGPRIGTFTASKFPNPGQTGNDYSYVTVLSGNTQPATVYGWGSGDATVHGGTAAGVGAAVCRSGRTSGWKCGTIEATGVTVSYSSGETILNLTRTTACSEGGDSGGSFITGPGQAQGVLSGGSGSCKGHLPNNRTRSFFQPLGPILSAYGLTLTTSP
jgi:streptogrisin C